MTGTSQRLAAQGTIAALVVHLLLGCCGHHGHASHSAGNHLAASGSTEPEHSADHSDACPTGKGPNDHHRCKGFTCVFIAGPADRHDESRPACCGVVPAVVHHTPAACHHPASTDCSVVEAAPPPFRVLYQVWLI